MAFLFYIVGTIAMCTAVEIKAGEARKKRDSADKDISPALSPTELLLLDMTETDFPVYKADYLYWDGVVLIRKLLIGAVISFMTGTPKSQCVLLILILQISLIIQNKRRPFMKDNINDLEELTLVASTTVLLVGLIAAAKERTDPVFLAILSVAVIGFISGSGILMSWKIIYHWYLVVVQMKNEAKSILQRSLGSLHEISKGVMGEMASKLLRSPSYKEDVYNSQPDMHIPDGEALDRGSNAEEIAHNFVENDSSGIVLSFESDSASGIPQSVPNDVRHANSNYPENSVDLSVQADATSTVEDK